MVLQIHILDVMALSTGIVAAVQPAAKILQPVRPPGSLSLLKNYVLICVTMLISCAIVLGCTRLLVSQPGYSGGNAQLKHVSLLACLCICEPSSSSVHGQGLTFSMSMYVIDCLDLVNI